MIQNNFHTLSGLLAQNSFWLALKVDFQLVGQLAVDTAQNPNEKNRLFLERIIGNFQNN